MNYVAYRGQTEDHNWPLGEPVPAELRAHDQLPESSNHGLSPERARIPADRSSGDKKRDQIFSRRLLQALHSTAFNRAMVGLVTFDQEEYVFIQQLAYILNKKNRNENLVDGWEAEVRDELDLVNSGSIFKAFSHPACGLVNFIHTKSDAVPLEERLECLKYMKKQIRKILEDPFLVHFISQLYDIGRHSPAEKAEYFSLDQNRKCPMTVRTIAECQDILLSSAFCEKCFRKFDSEESIMAHIGDKHPGLLPPNYAEERMNARERRIIKEALNVAKEIHDCNHDNCIECQFDIPDPEP